MVAAKHPLAAEAGLNVLKAGGNAVDAAITTAFSMGVLEPYMNGIGGGGFMVYHEASTGKNYFLDYFMPAPKAATPDMYEMEDAGATDTLGFRGVKDDANLIGHRSVGVPGLVAGAAKALEQFGTISLEQALQPAIKLAEDGFPVSWYTMLMMARSMPLLAKFPSTAKIFSRTSKYLYSASGRADRLVQSKLAETLKRIAAGGCGGLLWRRHRRGHRRGIAAPWQRHADGGPGRLYAPTWSSRASVTYRDEYQIVFGPYTGGDTTAETFNILEGFDFSGLPAHGPGGGASVYRGGAGRLCRPLGASGR